MAKTPVPMEDFQRLMLTQIRENDGCEDVTDVSIHHITDDRAESNWSVGVVGCGSAAPDAIALGTQLLRLKQQILEFDRMILAWHRSNQTSKRLHYIPGVGPMLAT